MKAFLKANGGMVTLMTTIIGVGFWITSSMADLQVEQAEKFQIQQEKTDAKFQAQSEKFYSMLEKINTVDKSSMNRDNKIEITLAKLDK